MSDGTVWQSLLLRHAVQRPPHSIGVFNLAEVQLITNSFALPYYYDHFKLYRYAFTLKHVKEIGVRTSWTELPPGSFPSLAEAVPIEPAPEQEEPSSPGASFKPVELPPIELHADLPDAVKEAVEKQIQAQVDSVRKQLEEQYAERTAQHEAQIAALEAKAK
jgi:hypothetical protein